MRRTLGQWLDLRACADVISERVNAADSSEKNADVAALVVRLKRQCWPFIGCQSVTVTMRDGSAYVPAIVTADENVVVCWEVAGTANAAKISHAEALPVVRNAAAFFVIADHMGRGCWVEHEAAARVGVPQEFIDARAALERFTGGRFGGSDWDVRAWHQKTAQRIARQSVPMASAAK